MILTTVCLTNVLNDVFKWCVFNDVLNEVLNWLFEMIV